jgi:HlyD family secretion protein
MATAHLPPITRRKAWGASAIATLGAVAFAAWGLAGSSIDRASAQEGRSNGPSVGTQTSGASRSGAVALARLLPASGLISVGARPGARVIELKVKEDDQVSAGTVLAVLEGHDAARSQLDLATAQRNRAQDERAARLVAARKAAETTQRRLDEGRSLYSQFGATLKGKDRYEAEMALYQVEMQAIKTQLDVELAQGAAPADGGGHPADPKRPADGSPEEAILKAQVALATAGLRETEVRAPTSGRILRVLAHPGELSSGTLLVMGDISSMIARAEVYQSDVPRIRPGDRAEVDILGTRVAGKVVRIGSIVGRNQLMSIDPRAMRDLRVVEVTIQLEQAVLASRFVDMEVEAVIRPTGEAAPSTPRNTLPPDRPAG